MRQKTSFTKRIQLWGVILIIGVTASITTVDIIGVLHDFNVRSQEMREDFITRRKQLIKQEVMQVVDLTRHALERHKAMAERKLRTRIEGAYATANYIYEKNRDKHSTEEIKQMILDALRPIRFDRGMGYYFITRLDGTVIMSPAMPSLEGKNLMHIKDRNGKEIIKDILEIIKRYHHGFYEYTWSRPGEPDKDFKKIAYVKLFKPYNWCIGTDLYLNDIRADIERNLLSIISHIRFGREGYIFVNRFNGDALVSNGKVITGNKKLWEVFDKDPERTKQLFAKEYQAAMKPHGDYIYYTHIKFTEPDKESPKLSYIAQVPEMKWIVGAGVYLDDLETDIATMQTALMEHILEKVMIFSLIAIGIASIFLLLLNRLNHRLRKDIDLVTTFFKRAAHSNEHIDRDSVQFQEFDSIARYANRMLEDRMKSEEALRRSEAKFRDIVESSVDPIWEIENSGHILIYISPQIKDMLGYSPKEMIGKPFSDFLPQKEARRIISILEEKAQRCEPIQSMEHKAMRKDGTEIIVESSAVPFFDEDHQLAGYRGISRDITQRKKADEELQKMQKLTSIGTLAGGIAHDFNNILMGVFGNIEIALMKLEPGHEVYRFIDNAYTALERATKLTKQLLTFARGGDPLLEAVDLQAILKTSVRFNLSGSNVKAHFDLPDDLWQIKADRGQIDHVIANLVINAKQAMPEGGTIYVAAMNISNIRETSAPHLSGDFVRFTIRDEGIGIPSKDIGRIFDPYFSTKDTGSGLGLATVHGIIKKHGGHISVESTPDAGTIFTLYLPAERNSGKSDTPRSTREISEEKGSIPPGRILIMDDEEMVREVAGAMLKQFGYEFEFATEGKEALEKYRTAMKHGKAFDVVIMDLTIPGGMGGKETIRQLLEIDGRARAIVASGYSTDPVMAHFSHYGFSGRVVKPFSMDDLKRVIEQVMNQS